jgi:hypothetical protein
VDYNSFGADDSRFKQDAKLPRTASLHPRDLPTPDLPPPVLSFPLLARSPDSPRPKDTFTPRL